MLLDDSRLGNKKVKYAFLGDEQVYGDKVSFTPSEPLVNKIIFDFSKTIVAGQDFPADVAITVYVVASGGGGGGGSGGENGKNDRNGQSGNGGAGGLDGAYAEDTLTFTAGEVLNMIINPGGNGGAGGPAAETAGTVGIIGGDCSVSGILTLSAVGGAPGAGGVGWDGIGPGAGSPGFELPGLGVWGAGGGGGAGGPGGDGDLFDPGDGGPGSAGATTTGSVVILTW